MTGSARPLLARVLPALVLLALAGCVRVDGPDEAAPTSSLRSEVDGVETWDLTAAPSPEAAGIEDGSTAAIFETDEPRDVVLLLPEGRELRVPTEVLTFQRFSGERDGEVSLGVRGPTVPPDDLVGQLEDLADQLQVDATGVGDFADEVAAAPVEQTERVRNASPTTTIGDLEVGFSANLAPIAEAGRLVLGGVWESER
ncbi:hypothetical protein RDV89_10710 [Nocardioides zeae]|uniref:Uncharacterized protein n=1 Tax=Nocardioides imazamoxiresistens TaxID=3231893 RepID=A0ABU3PWF7_9ACTN|nr:hypothetical protein [Nocardioides zeae]MDT9593539.1 hypothetical protein [Nocardioides zeae]